MTIEIHAVYLAVIAVVSYVVGIVTAVLRSRKRQREMDFMLSALGAYIVEKCFNGDDDAAQDDMQKWINELLKMDQGGTR